MKSKQGGELIFQAGLNARWPREIGSPPKDFKKDGTPNERMYKWLALHWLIDLGDALHREMRILVDTGSLLQAMATFVLIEKNLKMMEKILENTTDEIPFPKDEAGQQKTVDTLTAAVYGDIPDMLSARGWGGYWLELGA